MSLKRILPEENMSWQRPVLAIANEGIATKGNRYIVGSSPTGTFAALTTNDIVWYDGSEWHSDIPEIGWVIYDKNQAALLIYELDPSMDLVWRLLSTGEGSAEININALEEKTNPVDNDIFLIEDSDASFAQKKVKLSSIIAAANYFDDSEAQTYFAALTTALTGTQKGRITTLVKDIKAIFNTNNLASIFDLLYIHANETQEAASFNLAKRAHDITEVNSPTWTQWQGYTGNGSSSYLNPNYNPSSQAAAFLLSYGSFGIYVRGSIGSAVNMVELSSYDTTYITELQIRSSTNFSAFRINVAAASPGTFTLANSSTDPGTFSTTRLNATQHSFFAHKSTAEAMLLNASSNSNTIPNAALFILARSTNGAPSLYSTRQISISWLGAGMTKEQEDRLHYAFEKYMDSIGTGVLS